MKRYILLLFIFYLFGFEIYSQIDKHEVINIITNYIELNQEFLADPDSDNRKELEKYAEDKVNPALVEMQKIICNNHDIELLSKFIEMLLATKNSADEFPYYILGKIYCCQPEITWNILASTESKTDKKFLMGQLEFVLLYIANECNEKIFTKLKANIDSLKNEL
jgi:hypothetical protein